MDEKIFDSLYDKMNQFVNNITKTLDSSISATEKIAKTIPNKSNSFDNPITEKIVKTIPNKSNKSNNYDTPITEKIKSSTTDNIIDNPITEKIKSSMGGLMKFNSKVTDVIDGVKLMGGKLNTLFSTISKSLGPVIIAIQYLYKYLKAGFDFWKKGLDLATELRKETGLLRSQTSGWVDQINQGTFELAYLGVEQQDIKNSLQATYETYGAMYANQQEQIKLIAKANKLYGISENSLSDMFLLMEGSNQNTNEMRENTLEFAKSISKNTGTSLKKNIEAVASASSDVLKYMGSSPKEMIKATAQATRLKMELSEMASISDKMLDVESSIEAQMMANVMTGKNMNFEKARELSMQGDLAGATTEILKQVGSLSEFNSLNVKQKEAIANATGMEVKSIRESLALQKKEINSFTKTGDTVQSIFEQFSNIWKSFKISFLKPIMPIFDKLNEYFKSMLGDGKDFGKTMGSIGAILGKTVASIFKFVSGIVSFLKPFVDVIIKVLKPSMIQLGSILKFAFKTLTVIFTYIGTALKSFGEIFEGIFTLDFSLIKSGFIHLFEGLKTLWLDLFKGIGDFLLDSITNTFKNSIVGKLFKNMSSGVENTVKTTEDYRKVYSYANGTNNAKGGLSLVGENGAELLNVKKGSEIATNSETLKILNNVNNNNTNNSSNQNIEELLKVLIKTVGKLNLNIDGKRLNNELVNINNQSVL